MTLISFRNYFIMLLVFSYMILNYGIMLARFPPGGAGIPIGELGLLLVLITIHYPSTLPRLSSITPLTPLVLWWGYVFGRVCYDISEYGMWALRDATNVIESLFIIAGFVFALRPESMDLFFKWLEKLLMVGVLYGLTYPFAEYLQSVSPTIIGGAGHDVPIFFNYTNSSLVLVFCAAYLLLFGRIDRIIKLDDKMLFLIAVLLVSFACIVFQARTVYLQIIGVFIIIFIYRKDLIGKGINSIMLCFGIIVFLQISEITIKGRLGQTMSLEFLYNHFLSMAAIENRYVEGAAGGASLRLGWWYSLFARLTDSMNNLFFGLGYGFPLIDFQITGGISAREPHNSYLSILSRSGLIGLSLFCWVHYHLFSVWRNSYLKCQRIKWEVGKNRLLILFIFFIMIWIYAIGEDAFEKPFNAIPYYFFWGIVLRFSYHLTNSNIGHYIETNKNTVCS
jgi:hypothetical protein